MGCWRPYHVSSANQSYVGSLCQPTRKKTSISGKDSVGIRQSDEIIIIIKDSLVCSPTDPQIRRWTQTCNDPNIFSGLACAKVYCYEFPGFTSPTCCNVNLSSCRIVAALLPHFAIQDAVLGLRRQQSR